MSKPHHAPLEPGKPWRAQLQAAAKTIRDSGPAQRRWVELFIPLGVILAWVVIDPLLWPTTFIHPYIIDIILMLHWGQLLARRDGEFRRKTSHEFASRVLAVQLYFFAAVCGLAVYRPISESALAAAAEADSTTGDLLEEIEIGNKVREQYRPRHKKLARRVESYDSAVESREAKEDDTPDILAAFKAEKEAVERFRAERTAVRRAEALDRLTKERAQQAPWCVGALVLATAVLMFGRHLPIWLLFRGRISDSP